MLPPIPTDTQAPRAVALVDTQPIAAEGLRSLLTHSPQFRYAGSVDSLSRAVELNRHGQPDLLVLDKSFGFQSLLLFLDALREQARRPGLIVWGNSIAEPEALRFLQAGVQGIIRRSASLSSILACFRAVAAGATWMDENLFGDQTRTDRSPRGDLTPRECQVLDLVEQGLRNKEIAQELGIRPGTVKIHLKHIFEKTGVRGRYGLAISGLRERSVAAGSGSPAG